MMSLHDAPTEVQAYPWTNPPGKLSRLGPVRRYSPKPLHMQSRRPPWPYGQDEFGTEKTAKPGDELLAPVPEHDPEAPRPNQTP